MKDSFQQCHPSHSTIRCRLQEAGHSFDDLGGGKLELDQEMHSDSAAPFRTEPDDIKTRSIKSHAISKWRSNDEAFPTCQDTEMHEVPWHFPCDIDAGTVENV